MDSDVVALAKAMHQSGKPLIHLYRARNVAENL